MAKDPAFLFYSSDFLTGTTLMSHEQVGKYIRLLCLQHQTGRLSEQDMIDLCGGKDDKIWSKFVQDKNGFFFNKRLEEESEKRKKYCKSRGQNKKGKKHTKNISKSYDSHMENENENINRDDNKDVKDMMPEPKTSSTNDPYIPDEKCLEFFNSINDGGDYDNTLKAIAVARKDLGDDAMPSCIAFYHSEQKGKDTPKHFWRWVLQGKNHKKPRIPKRDNNTSRGENLSRSFDAYKSTK